MIGAMKSILWAVISGPFMIAVGLLSVVLLVVYALLGLVAMVFFLWAGFWGIHWAVTHDAQSFWWFLTAFGIASAAAAVITLLTSLVGSGTKGAVKGVAKATHARRNRRAVITVPPMRHIGPPALSLVD